MTILHEALAGRIQIVGWTLEQYHNGIRAGVVDEDTMTELLDGFIVRKDRSAVGGDINRVGNRHRLAVQQLLSILFDAKLRGAFVQTQQPISLPPNSEPEPDVAIIRGTINDHLTHPPLPDDVLSAIEVAHNSIQLDLGLKLRLYEAAAIRQYVVIDLTSDRVLVHEIKSDEAAFEPATVLTSGMTLAVRVADGVVPIDVSLLLSR